MREHFLLMTSDDVEREKPAPDGLLRIAAMHPGRKLTYVGDRLTMPAAPPLRRSRSSVSRRPDAFAETK